MAGHHHHHHVDADAGDRRVAAAIGVNVLLTVAQIVGGLVSGSLALIADAIHNLSDALALVIALAARKIARRPADETMTFGYGRAEVVAALINYTTLIVIGIWLAYEGTVRLFAPEPVAGWIMVWIAALALVIDLATAALTYAMSKSSMNIRAAFLHNVADALGSLAVIVAGSLILLYGWVWLDAVVTLAIAGYILWQSVAEICPVIRLLMLGSPPQLDGTRLVAAMREVEGVAGVHHVHLWMIDENRPALDAHVVIAPAQWEQADRIKADLRRRLEAEGIAHSTLEIERTAEACAPGQTFGGAPG